MFTCHEKKRSGRSSRRTALDHRRNFPEDPGGTDSGWLIIEDGFAAALGTVSIGASVGHMQNQWSGYTFGAAGRPSVTAKAARPAGGAVDDFLLAYDGFDPAAEGLREALTSTGNG